ncbi:MAG: hypothetical protein J0H27_11770 [Xanthomonadales bacterium]|nr:hypothetical protein [Xanthomonadales bacterium]ODU92519.1 MAG: hypothetical protein ABT18_12000 [Rhodanobacter sp. SCN 66-43]
MKQSIRAILVFGIGALALQGYAQAQEAQSAAAPTATAPAAATIPQENGKPVVKADSKENFEAIVAAIHQQMQPGGRWQYIDNSERTTIDGSFADMGKLYDQFGSVDKMDQAGKVRLLADQSTVNAILTKKDGDRLICQSEIPVGSHLPVRTCRTYAQVQAEQRGAQEMMRERAVRGGVQQKSGH